MRADFMDDSTIARTAGEVGEAMPTTLRELYNDKYRNEVWTPLVLRPDGWSTNRFDDVARLLKGLRGRALDVGCGSGRLTMAVAEQFDAIVGVDLSPVRIAQARAALDQHFPALRNRVEFHVTRGENRLQYETGSFDVVIACAVIEHVVDVFGAVSELARVCRLGGFLVLCVPNICYVRHVAALLLGRVPLTGSPTRYVRSWKHEGWDGGHLHYFSRRALADLLVLEGFLPGRWTGDGKWAKLRRWYPNFVGSLTVLARRTD
jgi:2-polyprenyl-3-methyl-5-hydroxy-6-metoxy-1,4-benzoquinol methylase